MSVGTDVVERKEKRPVVCPADFEVGDRFYSTDDDGIPKLATVFSSKPDAVSVLWDDGTEKIFTALSRDDISHVLRNCGKVLDLTLLEVGSRVSRFLFTKRIHMEVTKYVPGKEVEMKYVGRPNKAPLSFVASEEESLEKLMSIWELEG